MGAGQFKAVNCCTSIKSIHVIRKKTPQAAEPSGADSENGPSTTPLNYTTVVLTQKDFKENTFKEFSKFRPGITTVRFEIPSDGRWIPTDNEVEQLKTLPDLTSIDLSGCHEITRRGVEYLSFEPEKIKVLILRDCVKITDTFFDDIVHFPHLKHLDVRGCFRISDIAVKALTTLKLRYLDISVLATDVGILSSESHSTITDASIEALSRMTHLETLQMEGTSITDDGFIRLVTLRNLTSLNIAATHVTENGLRILKHFPKLQTLNIAACTFSDVHCAQKITSLTKLTSLNVSKAPGVTNAFLQCLSNLSNLEHLILSGCHQLTTQSLDSVNTLTQLTTLNANCCIGKRFCFLLSKAVFRDQGQWHFSSFCVVQAASFTPSRHRGYSVRRSPVIQNSARVGDQ